MAHGPQLLPDGEWVLFTRQPAGIGSWDQAQIVVESLDTAERITLFDGGRDARYLPTGHVVYARNNNLFAVPFDAETLQIGAASERMLAGVLDTDEITGAVQFDVSDNGSLVYIPVSTAGANLELTWVERNGTEEPTLFEPGSYRHPRVSPLGTAIVVGMAGTNDTDVMIGDTRRGTIVPLVLEAGLEGYPIWTPDGTGVVFFSARSGGGLFRRAADGTGPVQLLVGGQDWVASSWTSEGQLIYEELAGAQIRVGTTEDGVDAEVLDLVEGNYFDQLLPALSPDGRWLAYQSTESGALQVWVRSFPNIDDVKEVISTDGGISPVWSPDGDELYYYTSGPANRGSPAPQPQGSMMAVRIETEPQFISGTPVELFSLRDYVFPEIRGRQFDVAPDGRFLMIKAPAAVNGRTTTQIAIVQNWFEELKARVPVP